MTKSRREEITSLHQRVKRTESNLQISQLKLEQIGDVYRKYIREQFDSWGLTPSEKEVALILLKGLSLNDIAKLRDTKEKTVRQQASTIYHKCNVAGRNELSAWFFDDMLKLANIH